MDDRIGDVVHIPRRNSAWHMEFIEGVVAEGQLLQVDDLDLHRLLGLDVANLQVEDVLAVRIELTVGGFLPFFYRSLVLSLGLLLLLYPPLDALPAKGGREFIDAGIGIYRKTVFQLKEFLSGVLVGLAQGHIGDCIVDGHIVLG